MNLDLIQKALKLQLLESKMSFHINKITQHIGMIQNAYHSHNLPEKYEYQYIIIIIKDAALPGYWWVVLYESHVIFVGWWSIR
jgi:hypothetical protein